MQRLSCRLRELCCLLSKAAHMVFGVDGAVSSQQRVWTLYKRVACLLDDLCRGVLCHDRAFFCRRRHI